jgi:hypothetical protein
MTKPFLLTPDDREKEMPDFMRYNDIIGVKP